MDLLRFRVWWLGLSLAVILPGIVFILMGGLRPGLDFEGGSLFEIRFSGGVDKELLNQFGVVTPVSGNTFIIRSKSLDIEQSQIFKTQVGSKVGGFDLLREETVGPIIGSEAVRKAYMAVGAASVAILLYIIFAFRKLPHGVSSWRFGVATIVALLHDVLVVLGLFAILGYFVGIEVDSLFVTAILTIMGFSVHDTIVVFDRIRENLKKNLSLDFSGVVNVSVAQTLARSLNTSVTVVLVLVALLLFGGTSIRWFVVALLVGVVSGTYSSIFNASVILAWWEKRLGH